MWKPTPCNTKREEKKPFLPKRNLHDFWFISTPRKRPYFREKRAKKEIDLAERERVSIKVPRRRREA